MVLACPYYGKGSTNRATLSSVCQFSFYFGEICRGVDLLTIRNGVTLVPVPTQGEPRKLTWLRLEVAPIPVPANGTVGDSLNRYACNSCQSTDLEISKIQSLN